MPVLGLLATHIRRGLLLWVAAGLKWRILIMVGGEARSIRRDRKRLRIERLGMLLRIDRLLPDGIWIIVLLLLHWI